jgi:Acyl-protein synthetase, LuxE
MNPELSRFAARLRDSIASGFQNEDFDALAVELFAHQFEHDDAYKRFCTARKMMPTNICAIRGMTPAFAGRWTQVPFMPTGAFKAMNLSCIPPAERTIVFHSSGTTEQIPSRHFHNTQSLAVYEASLSRWFWNYFGRSGNLLFLTPHPASAPHSSLVHMFETLRQMTGLPESAFAGNVSLDGSWTVDFMATAKKLRAACDEKKPLMILGTAFSFVHLLDYLAENNLQFELPKDSRVMETGGYKNRSRIMPKSELHALISKLLGMASDNIVCEYGMSELGSQAYAGVRPSPGAAMFNMPVPTGCGERSGESSSLLPGRAHSGSNVFYFPPWARAQVVSPETNREVAEGESGLIRVFDLSNVFSVAAIQTEDLGIRRGDGFELIGRVPQSEPRGCSYMTS